MALSYIKKWKWAVDKRKVFGTLFTDLSKAFDCLSQELIIAKLNTYCFILPALKLIHNYLSKRQQITISINCYYYNWSVILFGMPQDSTPGSISFKIFLSDLFLIMNDANFVCNVDNNTIYDSAESKNNIMLLQESEDAV